MSNLSPQLQELLLATKAANQPTEADSLRIFEALRARLGDAAVMGESANVPATGSSGVVGGKLIAAAGIAGVALVGGLWFVAARNHKPPEVRATTAVSAEPQPSVSPATSTAVPAHPELLKDSNTAPAASTEHAETRPALSRPTRDNLSEEVAIMSRAETALHSGKPELALRLLNEHERRFGNGQLREERIAARVQALCALGRKAEADTQMARLSPQSLHGKSQACGSR
jgi:hypothetical protein